MAGRCSAGRRRASGQPSRSPSSPRWSPPSRSPSPPAGPARPPAETLGAAYAWPRYVAWPGGAARDFAVLQTVDRPLDHARSNGARRLIVSAGPGIRHDRSAVRRRTRQGGAASHRHVTQPPDFVGPILAQPPVGLARAETLLARREVVQQRADALLGIRPAGGSRAGRPFERRSHHRTAAAGSPAVAGSTS